VVGIQNLDLNSKFSISVKCGPLSSVIDFSELIGMEFVTPTFYKNKILCK
jgi:hypothetical protein